MKKDTVSAYVYMRRDTPPSLYVPVHILDDPSSLFNLPVTYVLNVWPVSQPKNK